CARGRYYGDTYYPMDYW
nr:immunoglobulin heavy chain junction region [Mus musculus]